MISGENSKTEKVSVLDLPVQDPTTEEFSSVDLNWTKFATTEHNVEDVALIPYDRVDAFIIGESSNLECPTRFHIERGRKRKEGSLKNYRDDEYLQYRLYWCSFGPENYGEGGGILPSRRYRLNTRNRAARPQSMRGCTCHFVVKRLYSRPSIALVIYNERRHVNKSGLICHGPLDRDAIGPGAKKIPYICNEIQQQTMSLIYLGVPEENVLQKHIEGVQRYCGSNPKVNSLASQYVQKLEMIIKRSTHELDLDDQASIRLWVQRQKKSVFFFQDSTESDTFILGIQTDWQLQQMIRFGHQNLLAAHSAFGIKRLKYPLCSLIVFDSQQHALPVAWIITRSSSNKDISKWMKALVLRIQAVEPSFKISGFLIDDAATELDPIRNNFDCPVLFCLWRLRKSWLRNITKRCSNVQIHREIFRRLGEIMYSIWNEDDYVDIIGKFIQDFVDLTSFIQYFKECWVPKIEMWLSTMKSLPLASQEASSAIEAYYRKLKMKLYDDSHLGAFQRVDWLVHKLTTELHSSYWLDRYADESGLFETVKAEYINSTSWSRALKIPDTAVVLDDENHLVVKISSQNDSNKAHSIWNPGTEFAFCDCPWSLLGNFCKHTIKANMTCHKHKHYPLSMSFKSFQQVLLELWKKPVDDSIELDQSNAWTIQLQEKIQRMADLSNSSDISNVVNKLPLKWNCKKERTSTCKRVYHLALPSTSKISGHKNRKRRRLLRL